MWTCFTVIRVILPIHSSPGPGDFHTQCIQGLMKVYPESFQKIFTEASGLLTSALESTSCTWEWTTVERTLEWEEMLLECPWPP